MDGAISQLHMLRISKSVSWVLWIPVLSVSCQEAMTLVIKPCALIPDLVHMRHTLVPRCCVIRHMVLIALKREKVLRLPLRSYHLYNRISQLRFDIHNYHLQLIQIQAVGQFRGALVQVTYSDSMYIHVLFMIYCCL